MLGGREELLGELAVMPKKGGAKGGRTSTMDDSNSEGTVQTYVEAVRLSRPERGEPTGRLCRGHSGSICARRQH